MADIDPDEPLFAKSTVEKFDQRVADLIEFAKVFYVSDEVRTQCEAELAAAKKRHYKV